MLKAVIFDMDGVLIDSEPIHFESDVNVLKRFNKELSFDFYKKYIGTTMYEIWKNIKQEYDLSLSMEELIKLADIEKEKIIKETGYREIKGVANLVKDIYQSKYLLAVASSSPNEYIVNATTSIKLYDLFNEIVSGALLDNPKPSPDIFLYTAKLLGVNPEECMVIEDSTNGINAAKAAGMICIGFKNPNSGDQDLSNADCVIDSFEHIGAKFLEDFYYSKGFHIPS